jgi:hypothetical protein
MAKKITKKTLLKEALANVQKYLKQKDADLSKVADYLEVLKEWINQPVVMSNPPLDPTPPPHFP